MYKKSLLYVQEVFTMYQRSLYYMSKKSLLCIQKVFTLCPRSLYYISKMVTQEWVRNLISYILYVQEVLSLQVKIRCACKDQSL